MKPYHQIPIDECGEVLVPIPLERFGWISPHPYQALGAPYGHQSPFFLRQQVLERLLQAQQVLQQHQPGWRFLIFDAYRPLAVQQFMVDYTLTELAQARGLSLPDLSPQVRQTLLEEVHQFWAPPSPNPATPPPHSTGAAIDLTLQDERGQPVPMGSPIDEISPRSHPQYFGDRPDQESQTFHHHRQLLWRALSATNFQQHPNEWWHFSWGDQLWAWLTTEQLKGRTPASLTNPSPPPPIYARYGRVEG